MDQGMAVARKNLDWDAQFECAIDGGCRQDRYTMQGIRSGDACSMCGELCAIKVARDALKAWGGRQQGFWSPDNRNI